MSRSSCSWLGILALTALAAPDVRGQCPPQWLPTGSGMNGGVSALTVCDGELIAGGVFTTAGGQPANRIARWNGSAWLPLGTGVDGSQDPVVDSLAVYNNELIAGGYFTSAGGQAANCIARWNGSAWAPLGTGMSSHVYALAVYNGELIAGGYFGSPFPWIARWNGSTWAPLGSGLGGGIPAVSVLIVHNNELVAGGRFETAAGQGVNHIASWNGSTWAPLGTGMAGGGWSYTAVLGLAGYNNELIAGGLFTTASGQSASYIARWNGSTWATLGTGMGGGLPYMDVQDLAVYHNELFAGGWFTTAGGQQANWIARWNGSAWAPLGAGLNDGVRALTVYNNELIAGGDFTTAGGQPANFIARWGCACYPDCTADGSLTVADWGCFQTKFVAADPYADCNGDGQRTVADFGCFQTKFVVGCP